MSDENNSNSGGIGILGLLGVLFVGLKLTGFIDWSWWWVTSPFWGGVALWLAFVIVMFIGAALLWLLAAFLSLFTNPK